MFAIALCHFRGHSAFKDCNSIVLSVLECNFSSREAFGCKFVSVSEVNVDVLDCSVVFSRWLSI